MVVSIPCTWKQHTKRGSEFKSVNEALTESSLNLLDNNRQKTSVKGLVKKQIYFFQAPVATIAFFLPVIDSHNSNIDHDSSVSCSFLFHNHPKLLDIPKHIINFFLTEKVLESFRQKINK